MGGHYFGWRGINEVFFVISAVIFVRMATACRATSREDWKLADYQEIIMLYSKKRVLIQ